MTASLVNDIHSLLSPLPVPQIPSEASEAVKSVSGDSIVLVSHPYEGVAPVDMLAGELACCLLHCLHH